MTTNNEREQRDNMDMYYKLLAKKCINRGKQEERQRILKEWEKMISVHSKCFILGSQEEKEKYYNSIKEFERALKEGK